MFGLLKGCYLDVVHRPKWGSFYCGLCHSLNAHTGAFTRILTNSDGVLMSVLVDAQSEHTAATRARRCAFRGFRTVQALQPDSPAGKYAALISILMGASKLMDHVVDGDTYVKYFPGLAMKVAQGWMKSAQRLAASLGVDVSTIRNCLLWQNQLERVNNKDFLFYSQAVEEAAAAACSNTAVITARYENIEPLRELGRMYGRIVYLLDSFRDHMRDIKKAKFNPLAESLPMNRIAQEARSLFDRTHNKLVHCFHSLQLVRPDFCQGLFTHYIPAVGNALLSADAHPIEPGKQAKKDHWWDNCCCCDCSCCQCCDCCDGSGGCDCCGCDC